ncbi:MAG TPA: hypothetical protein VKB13_05590 [Gaiellaceae bacterium]|nr:hypothetical protein [Gaiellaceae bacterium]
MTDTITPMLAKPASSAGMTPGRLMISLSGAAGPATTPVSGAICSAIRLGSGRTARARPSAMQLMNPAAIQGIVRTSASSSLPEKSGLKNAGPRIAPKTAPKSTYEMPRPRRAAGYMSPAAVRTRSAIPLEEPIKAKPAMTATAEPVAVPRAVNQQPIAPRAKPPAMTGMRPKRSISRPAGTAVSAEATRKIAGPSPSSFSKPVTRTKVSEETAATSCSTAELTASTPARSTVFRRIGRLTAGAAIVR